MHRYNHLNDSLDTSADKKQFSAYIFEEFETSLPNRFKQLAYYAKNKNRYFFGIPKSSISDTNTLTIKDKTQQYLQSRYGNITIKDFFVGELNAYVAIWDKLQKDYGYDNKTNELTFISNKIGSPAYLYDGYLQISQRSQKQLTDQLNPKMSFKYGKVYDRHQDINREQVVDTGLYDKDSAYISYTYQIQKEADVPPNTPAIHAYTNKLAGYAQKGCTVEISSGGRVLANIYTNDGYFEYYTQEQELFIRCINDKGWASSTVQVTNGFIDNTVDLTVREPKTITETKYDSFKISLDYLNPDLQEGAELHDTSAYIQCLYELDGSYYWFVLK